MPKLQNPFSAHRWETEQTHLIWVPPVISKVAAAKPCFIGGLRGAGKTALLNCIDPIAPQKRNYKFLNPEDLPRGCIGVYINIVSEFTEFFRLLEAPGTAMADATSHMVRTPTFQAYVILNSLARTLEIIDDCRRRDILSYPSEAELSFIRAMRSFEQATHSMTPTPSSFLEYASALKKVCMSIRINSLRQFPDRIFPLLEQIEPLSFYWRVCETLTETEILQTDASPFHVKVCLDDVHRFTYAEQTELNAIVAVARAPITWNLSYISGHYEPVVTGDLLAPLTNHDVEVLDLDYRNDPEAFRMLCRQTFLLRTAQPNEPSNKKPRYEAILGRPGLNALFEQILNHTRSEEFIAKIQRNLEFVASSIAKAGAETQRGQTTHSTRDYLYQTYIFVTLFGEDRERFTSFLADRTAEQTDNYFRQKNVAALVCAANELSRKVPYAGSNVIHSLSDGCVRDFLRLLAVIYDQTEIRGQGRNFSDPSKGILSFNHQTDAFITASKTYLSQLDNSRDRHGYYLSRVVSCLGVLTRLLQSKNKPMALSVPERGIFRIDFSERSLFTDSRGRSDHLRQVLMRGQYIGVIRLLRGSLTPAAHNTGGSIEFRLHRVAAPAFNYSSRGPIRVVQIPLQFLLELIEAPTQSSELWAEKVLGALLDLPPIDLAQEDQENLL